MQVERSIDHIDVPNFQVIGHSVLNDYESGCQNSGGHFCRRSPYSQCVDSIQEPSKLSRTMEGRIEEAKRKTKKKEKPKEEIKPKKVEKPKKIIKEKPIAEEQPLPVQEQPSRAPKEKAPQHSGRRKPSEQYLSCCSSCCRYCCVEKEKEEEESARFASSCSCKHEKKNKTSSRNREDEDSCGEFFDLIRESMEEVVKKSFLDIFGRYFSCCIDKINRLSCQIEHTECVLKKFHQDLKFRISYYDRRSTEQMQTLCEMMKRTKLANTQQERNNGQCKSKCKPPIHYCDKQNESSSSDNNFSNKRQNVTYSNLCNSKCPNVFGDAKSQYQKCGQKRENSRCKNQSAGSSNQSMPSCDEILIDECDFAGQESRNIQKAKKQETKSKVRQRKQIEGTFSDGSNKSSKKCKQRKT